MFVHEIAPVPMFCQQLDMSGLGGVGTELYVEYGMCEMCVLHFLVFILIKNTFLFSYQTIIIQLTTNWNHTCMWLGLCKVSVHRNGGALNLITLTHGLKLTHTRG